MKSSKASLTMIAAGVLATSAAWAQQPALVNVDLSNVASTIATNIKVDASQVPATVQVPVGVAASVCGVAANVLARQAAGDAPCKASATSAALDQVVQKQLKTAQK